MNAGVDSEERWEDGTVLLSKQGFAPWLRQRVEERIPAAVVRFGDAEARMLVADRGDAESMDIAIRKLERESGLTLSPDDVLAIKAGVTHAFDEADVLGIRFVRGFLPTHREWMEKLFEIYAERVAAGRRPVALAHCLLGHDVLGMLPDLLAGRPVSVISCRDLKPVLEDDWGLSDIGVYQVPSQHMLRDVDGAYEAALHDVPIWPDVHDRIEAELTVRERGEVFLVGAGLFANDLCIRIRDRGGIALDMGSALDKIAGKVTRGPARRILDLYAKGMSAADIAVQLQSLYPVEIDEDRVSGVLKQHLGDRFPG
jgi:hypothetical protein